MPRYFIEVGYKGTNYAGFQIQKNATTIQGELEKALAIYFKIPWALTGASRTDSGVHARQNFYHADVDISLIPKQAILGLNAILPNDIVLQGITLVAHNYHARFAATARSYAYTVYQTKNPFISGDAYFYPYPLNINLLNQAADLLFEYTNYESFSKKHTQVLNNNCTITQSKWVVNNGILTYSVTANRFLRGMVRGLVATMLKVGTSKYSINEFKNLLENPKLATAFFNAPAHGLCLVKVHYP